MSTSILEALPGKLVSKDTHLVFSMYGKTKSEYKGLKQCIVKFCLSVLGGSVEITVTFAPDHASDHYSDGVKIELFGKVSHSCT